jgi:hypothetical protein
VGEDIEDDVRTQEGRGLFADIGKHAQARL